MNSVDHNSEWANQAGTRVAGQRRIAMTAGWIAILAGTAFSAIAMLAIYFPVLAERKFADFGPTLFMGDNPDQWTFAYIFFVLGAFPTAWLLTLANRLRWPGAGLLDQLAKIHPGAILATLLPLAFAFELILLRRLDQPIFATGLAVQIALIGAIVIYAFLREGPQLWADRIAGFLIALTLGSIFLLHIGKFHTVALMGYAAGHFWAVAAVCTIFALCIIAVAMVFPVAKTKRGMITTAVVGFVVYLISISENRVYWGVDVFHEGETVISPMIMLGLDRYTPDSFTPMHGFGRNIWPGYIATLIEPGNLYLTRLIYTLSLALVPALATLCACYVSNSVRVGVALFLATYFFPIFTSLDVDPLVFVLVMIAFRALFRNEADSRADDIAVSACILALSLYSKELLLFVNVAMLASLTPWAITGISQRRFTLPRIHLYYAGLLIAFLLINALFLHRDLAVLEAISKSPNMLERDILPPAALQPSWLFILTFFPLFVWFCLATSSSMMANVGARLSNAHFIVGLLGLIWLMYFLRAFNRSDEGHIIYGFHAATFLIPSLLVHFGAVRKGTIVALILFAGATSLAIRLNEGHSFAKMFPQSVNVDGRVPAKDVQLLQTVGEIKLPALLPADSLATTEELAALKGLVDTGTPLFDLSNQPVLIYGVVPSEIIDIDIHTLFYGSAKDQTTTAERLRQRPDAVVVWSGNHWTETLDYTYVETRLPLLSNFLLSNFPYIYRVGRFVFLSKTDRSVQLGSNVRPDAFRDRYELGFAPERLGTYPEETVEVVGSADTLTFKLDRKASAIVVKAAATATTPVELVLNGKDKDAPLVIAFKAIAGDHDYFIRLNNLPRYVTQTLDSVEIRTDPAAFSLKRADILTLIK